MVAICDVQEEVTTLDRKQNSVTKLNSNYMQVYEVRMGRKRLKRQRLIRRLALLAVVVLIMFGGLATYHVKQRNLQADKREEYAQLKEEHAALKKEESRLTEEIGLLKDEDYVLEIARTNYFFSKEGEMIFKIPNENPSY